MKRLGKKTVTLPSEPHIISTSSIVGKKEGEGPLAQYFDFILNDEYWGEKSFEKTEIKILKENLNKLLQKSNKTPDEVNYVLAGDLLNQCISSSYAVRESEIPFIGLYGACSTMVESMAIGSMLVDGGFADNVIAITSSHFCSAERQFRFPLEQGTQRPPTAQWTVTGSGAALISTDQTGPKITHVTVGKVVDMGIKDANNMGAAMAPAAADTIYSHLKETGREPNYYDLIVTGDLGYVGGEIVKDILMKNGINIKNRYNDCGILIFDKQNQDTHSGGSGCGCCGSVFAGYLYNKLQKKELNRILLVATGALMNTTAVQQGEAIAGIAHAVAIEN